MPVNSKIPVSSKTSAVASLRGTSSKQALQQKPLKHKPIRKPQPIQNRVKVLLVHIPKLSIQGQARLAAEVGVSRSTISRLVHGRINPSYRLARGVTDVLERMLGKPLDMREVFSTDGTYLTPSGCALCRCHGCLPDGAWDEDGHLKPGWEDARPGDWSLARADAPEQVDQELSRDDLSSEEGKYNEEQSYNEEKLNGGFSGSGEYEDGRYEDGGCEEGDEEANAEQWQGKLEAAKLRDASASKPAKLGDKQRSAR